VSTSIGPAIGPAQASTRWLRCPPGQDVSNVVVAGAGMTRSSSSSL